MSEETEWVLEATKGIRRTAESRSEAEAVDKHVEQLDVETTSIPPEPVTDSQAAVEALDESTGWAPLHQNSSPTHLHTPRAE